MTISTKRTSQLAAAASLTGTELVEISRPSATVTLTATTISALAADNSYNDSANGFIAAGFAVGRAVRVSGFTGDAANNIFSAVITALTAGKMTIGGADGDVIVDDAAGESVTITQWESVRSTVADLLLAELIDDRVAALLVAGTNVTLTYDDGAGTLTVAAAGGGGGGGGTVLGGTPGGRLTLTSGTPVTTADVAGATAIYYTPYVHNIIGLWDGAAWAATTFAETSLALGTLTSAKNYDVFGYLNSGALALEMLAWTNDTTRATAVTLQDGRYCKSGDKTRLYLGTFRTTSTTQTEDSGGGVTTQVGGRRFLWNMYNRVRRSASVFDSTAYWSYTTATWRQANNSGGNKVEAVLGLADAMVSASAVGTFEGPSSSGGASVGIGLDSTTPTKFVGQGYTATTPANDVPVLARYSGYPGAGYHYLAWIERGPGGGTAYFMGGGNATHVGQDGLVADLMG